VGQYCRRENSRSGATEPVVPPFSAPRGRAPGAAPLRRQSARRDVDDHHHVFKCCVGGDVDSARPGARAQRGNRVQSATGYLGTRHRAFNAHQASKSEMTAKHDGASTRLTPRREDITAGITLCIQAPSAPVRGTLEQRAHRALHIHATLNRKAEEKAAFTSSPRFAR